ncbi:hypothetical protein SAZ_37735 [Streptomyces noursei ZPM]|uniref:Roadblock/LAMTOR2 domain-containing protein n=1 Tax=Streptomyces noursei TaxID=1971 RepID=A0A401RCU1_STRNR|nr:hypothetical protein [Streptomyces noursei]AKA07500.1 hypothetical protein SAZ_37735 [Streptomyces noursei ZPM]EOS97497.1 hypothetical protein K530_43688 [Streptomyces noursei CCRC 11814]EXU87103.1 hypothetical protein P354_37960 [Streptomyces noursei PD-1]UWS76070.1 hypothetical protein N1H47_35440 [Streptomyces noursei]GCB95443.1 hypothetical protein SALB_08248 [Streptomyces noursei]
MPGIDQVLARAMEIPGVLGAGLTDWTSGLTLGTAGRAPHGDHDAAAADTAEVVQAVARNATFDTACGNGEPLEDLIVTTGSSYHLIRRVPTAFDSQTCLHLWLDRGQANLAIARLRLRDLVTELVGD